MSSYYKFYDREDTPETATKKKRSARSRLQLTTRGQEVLSAYQTQVTGAQSGDGGRDALEATQEQWAKANFLEPSDALLLAELRDKPQTILELTRSLDTCGIKRPMVQSGVDRLATHTFIEPVA